MFLLETSRLLLREITLEDASFIFELVNTPNWLRFIGDRGIKTKEDAKAYIEESYLESYKTHGFGAYVMIQKSEGVVIGSCGLYKRPNLDYPDIGFAMLPQYGKMGYAFEAASALMEYAKTTLNLNTILAITLQENENSIALLEKIGLREIDTVKISEDTEELLLFST
jgi:[ribosomal protein S5]-alanine N-acetyltransferase